MSIAAALILTASATAQAAAAPAPKSSPQARASATIVRAERISFAALGKASQGETQTYRVVSRDGERIMVVFN